MSSPHPDPVTPAGDARSPEVSRADLSHRAEPRARSILAPVGAGQVDAALQRVLGGSLRVEHDAIADVPMRMRMELPP
jgi:hypothetical protein